MARQITDDEDRLKRQARRRLIGAVALTTAIVVVLPMVLESEPKPVGQDIELRIPDKDKVGEFVPNMEVLPASAPVAASPVASVVSAPAPVLNPPAPPALIAPVPPVVVPAPPAAKTLAAAAKPEPVKPIPAKAEPIKTEPAKAEQVKPGSAKPEPAKLDAKADHAKAAGAAPQAGFAVQVGAFSSADTAHSWQKNLSKQGFKAYTEKTANKIRVRTGPYATREEANKVRHKLEAKGLHTNIVELD